MLLGARQANHWVCVLYSVVGGVGIEAGQVRLAAGALIEPCLPVRLARLFSVDTRKYLAPRTLPARIGSD